MEETIFRKPTEQSRLIFRAREDLSMLDMVDVTLVCEAADPHKMIVGKFLSEEQDRYRAIAPCLTLAAQDFQMLVDDLWTIGVRPRAARGSAGQLDAVQAHLKDMRDLVFEYHTTKKKGGK